jgi:glutamate synthase (NADPH/NADH) small chain
VGKKRTITSKRYPASEQDARARIGNFQEVTLAYDADSAIKEAMRCIQCKNPRCVRGCPVRVPIPQFIEALRQGNPEGAMKLIKARNLLPSVCGRVCPQETQCERQCIVGRKNEPVAIGRLERYVADTYLFSGDGSMPDVAKKGARKKVAVVGSGPAGLSCAYDLRKKGYSVTVFEAFHEAGGVLCYGIPEFRLPKRIVAREIETLKRMGVEIVLNAVVGKLILLDEILGEYDACFIGTGAGLPRFMGIEGENLKGVYSANEFLTRANLMRAYRFPEYDTPVRLGRRVAVVGGGNVAMDAVRTALRLGAEKGIVVYRRSEAEMPARREEIQHAKEEGVHFELLANPVRIMGEDGWVRAIECQRMELSEPDDSGRRRPRPLKGSEFQIPVDAAIMAVGTNANPIVTRSAPTLKLSSGGYIDVEPETGRTSIQGVYAGGDIVTGSATVISAMGAGRRAARAMDRYMSGD